MNNQPPAKWTEQADKWLDKILDDQRSIGGRNLFVLDLSNLIMRNPFFWNKVVEQLQSEAVEKYVEQTKCAVHHCDDLVACPKCVEEARADERKKIFDEVYWEFRNIIHNGHTEITCENGVLTSFKPLTDYTKCYVCDVIHKLEANINKLKLEQPVEERK